MNTISVRTKYPHAMFEDAARQMIPAIETLSSAVSGIHKVRLDGASPMIYGAYHTGEFGLPEFTDGKNAYRVTCATWSWVIKPTLTVNYELTVEKYQIRGG